jgi:hypothetical protein
MRAILMVAFFRCTGSCFAQHPCDTNDYVGGSGDFDRIFGGKPEPWQVCGDTLQVNGLRVVYSYPQCLIWGEQPNSSIRWSVDLNRFEACKVIYFQPLIEDPPRQWKGSDIVFQSSDKRIFGLRSKKGRIKPIDPT